MQQIYLETLSEEFYSLLISIIGHLRHQQNLVAQMRSTCSKVGDIGWVSKDNAASRLKKHIIFLTAHFDANKIQCISDRLW